MEPCEVVVAVDLGGTRMKCGLVAADGAVLHRETRPTPRTVPDRNDGGRAVLDALLETVVELGQKAAADGHTVRAVGVVVPGIIDAEHGTVSAENLLWVGTPVLAELQAAVGPGRQVVLAHDVRGGGYAELRQGALKGTTNSLFLPLGTGIAAAMVVDGSLVSGDGYAGELGHTRFVHGQAAELCACGQYGCLETVASAAALARRYGVRTGRVVDGAREVLELLAEGDADAAIVWEEALAALVDALVLYTTLVAPTRIAIGGGLVGAGETLLAPLRAGLHERLTFQREPEIVAAVLGEDAGCLGAALMAWDRVTLDESGEQGG
ncbi:ROK family protein [Kribbella sp. ALI-6-A]|uniref:ROK family protein n=1 Tax=Kribbella sp. ALI-6-A TaxID=1933817 RepID=UPI001ED9EC77|nr:ROK family protein [Kribbella sp. ALI-6-A]